MTMKIGSFEGAAWDEPRIPLLDEASDAPRRGRYWDWSNAAGHSFEDGTPKLTAVMDDGSRWVRIATPQQADYEAFHMQHSIGHSFDHYSAMGEIHSLRSADNRPTVTVLVAGGRVVHARGPANAALDGEAMRSLEAVAARSGWEIADPSTL